MKRILVIAMLVIAVATLAFSQLNGKKVNPNRHIEQTAMQGEREIADDARQNDMRAYPRFTDARIVTNPSAEVRAKLR